MKIPESSDVKGRKLPYVFIGDEAFSLRKDFLKPYNVKQLKRERKIFNYCLSRARRITENVFGILVARFGIFKSHINIQLDNIKDVVMGSCALHNFLRRTSPDTYTPSECFDTEDLQNGTVTAGLRSNPSSMAKLKRGNNKNNQLTGKEVGSQFVEYFNNEGKVPWQDNCIQRSTLSRTFTLNLLVYTLRILYE